MARLTNNPDTPPTPLGQSPAFQAMLGHVSQLAGIDRPVLVLGERGTGKELVAGRLAYLSRRWDRPFIKLNCAALSDSLLDSELFGHEAGAFTGAARRRAGRFEAADSGTLFLDEIGAASAAVQEKLLRVIEYGAFDRVGGNETLRVDVRVIAATNADLPDLARNGRFRADLLDRLAFDVVAVPPLRERGEDVLLLANHFARRMTSELGRDVFAGFTDAAATLLLAHPWPGNVRELRNAVERSLCRGETPSAKLDRIILDPYPSAKPAPSAPPTPSQDFTTTLRETGATMIRAALDRSAHNQRAAAAALGLTYYQFRHQMKLHAVVHARPSVAEAKAAEAETRS